MGADLIVGVCVQDHPGRTAEDLTEKLNQMTKAQAEKIFELVEGASFDELYGDIYEDEPDEVLNNVKDWITEFIRATTGGGYHRNIVYFQSPQLNKRIAIGGGESWGDTPAGYNAVVAAAEWGEW